ncbi:MAG: hypothetical protein GF313_10835 [Caldithrix sp.]|nr:hypothetical protein [Caldithrix sp.]
MQLIETHAVYFKRAAATFNIDDRCLKAIVFVERTLNYDWKDDALDIPLAYSGHNSSIGFCQIKMKTAYWIEVNLSDSTSEFYPGNFYHNMLPVSKSPGEIIEKLQRDSLNIHYAAGYIKIIQNFWKKAGFPIENRADILGTLYSTGLFLPSGEIRIPNKNPKANLFGKKVKEAYRLFIDL